MRHPFKIKICGITTIEDAHAIAESGADAVGLNFYAKGKRYVPVESAREIVRQLKSLPSPPVVIGVFVNLSVDEILEHVRQVDLDTVQLHGDESPELLHDLLNRSRAAGLVFDTIRAIRTAPHAEAPLDVAAVEAESKRWTDAGVNAILVDAAASHDYGGTGKQVDWNGVARLSVDVPVILAGGLTADNVADAIRAAEPCSVDVASGVEDAPGKKNHDQVMRFVKNAGMMQ